MTDERELTARLRLVYDQAHAEGVKKGIQAAKDELAKAAKGTADVEKGFQKMRERAEQMQQVFTRMGAASAAILGPMLIAANQYAQKAGLAEGSSKRWLEAQERLNKAGERLGREVAEAALPILEKAADLAEKAASWVEKNPGAVKAALLLGGSLGAISAIGTVASQVYGMVGTLGRLGLIGGGAGGAGLGGAIAGLVNPLALVTAGLLASYAAIQGFNELLNKTGANQKITEQRNQVRSDGKKIYPGLIANPEERALQVQLNAAIDAGNQSKIQGLTSQIKNLGVESQKAAQNMDAGPTGGFAANLLKAYEGYARAETEAQQQFLRQRTQMTRDFNQAEVQAQNQYDQQRLQSARNFARQEAQAEASYYQERARKARDFGVETARAEEDHQRQLRQLQKEHQNNLADLAENRDALGMVREMRSYENQRRQAEEDYRIQAQRKNEDYAREMGDMAQQFAQQRAQRLKDFQAQAEDAKVQFEAERKNRQAQFARQLADLEESTRQERSQRRNALTQQLQDLADGLGAEQLLRRKFTVAMLDDLRSALAAAGVNPNGTLSASGAAASLAAGGAGTSSSQTLTYNDNRRVSGDVPASVRTALVNDVLSALQNAFS